MLRQFAESGVKVHAIGLPHPRTMQGLRVVKLAGTATTLATAIARLRQLIIFTRPQIVDDAPGDRTLHGCARGNERGRARGGHLVQRARALEVV